MMKNISYFKVSSSLVPKHPYKIRIAGNVCILLMAMVGRLF